MFKIINTSLQNNLHSNPFLELSMNYFGNPVTECNLLKIRCNKSSLPNIKDVNVIYPKKNEEKAWKKMVDVAQ